MKQERLRERCRELSSEEVREICIRDQKEGLAHAGLGEETRPPLSEKLNGRSFHFKFDDFRDLYYEILSPKKLRWSENGSWFYDEYCKILQLDQENLFLINHLRSFTFPLESFTIFMDLDNCLVTLIHSFLGASERPREVEREFHFGYADSEREIPAQRHEFTRDMTGTAIEWQYDRTGCFTAIHTYVSHLFKTDLIRVNGEDVACGGFFCDYVKIRENFYIMSWVEQSHIGTEMCTLINLNTLHDVAATFGISLENRLESYTLGAVGKWIMNTKQHAAAGGLR